MSIRGCTAEKPSNGQMLHHLTTIYCLGLPGNINASDSKTFDYFQNHISAIKNLSAKSTEDSLQN